MRNTYLNYRVVVIDNSSTDNSMDKIKAWADGKLVSDVLKKSENPLCHLSNPPVEKPLPYIEYNMKTAKGGDNQTKERTLTGKTSYPLLLIQTHTNLGFAGGNNVGIRYVLSQVDCGYIWLLNNDTVIESGALSELVHSAETYRMSAIWGSTLKKYSNPNEIQMYGGAVIRKITGTIKFITTTSELPRLSYVSGASLFARTHSFKEIGLLPEEYFLYWEDADWCTKAKLRGYELIHVTESVVYHRVAMRQESTADFYYSLNGLKFLKKYHRKFLITAIPSQILKAIKRALMGKERNAKTIVAGVKEFLRTTP